MFQVEVAWHEMKVPEEKLILLAVTVHLEKG